jgi:peptidoglycan hydrolase-like protein with peptidoglycan-binding domain
LKSVKEQWVAFFERRKEISNMRRIVLITMTAFVAGLFAVSQGFGAGEYGESTGSSGATGMEQGGMEQGGTTGMEHGAAGSQQSVAGVQMNSSQIKEMQKLLSEKGYNPGAADGVMGSQTKDALKNFQQSQGIAATGEPDEETLRALAPDTPTQEKLGLSPEFGGEQQQNQMQQQPMEQPNQPQKEEQTQPRDGGIGESENPASGPGSY